MGLVPSYLRKRANFQHWEWHKRWSEQCGVFGQILRNLSQDVTDEWSSWRSWECPLDQNAPRLFQTDPTQGHYYGHCQDEHIKIRLYIAVTLTSTVVIPRFPQSCQSDANIAYVDMRIMHEDRIMIGNPRWGRACLCSVERRRADWGGGGLPPSVC